MFSSYDAATKIISYYQDEEMSDERLSFIMIRT
jgi:hypothetical protein